MSNTVDMDTSTPPMPAACKKRKMAAAFKERNDNENDFILDQIADWKVARATQQIEWARYNQAVKWGYGPSDGIPVPTCKALRQMEKCEGELSKVRPYAMLAAHGMLEMVIDILTVKEGDPENPLGHGPALKILRNVTYALQWIDGETLTCGPDGQMD